MAPDVSKPPLCVLLLPRELERFILRDQAEDLLRAPNVVAVDPPRLPYGAFGRMPGGVADALGARQARRLAAGDVPRLCRAACGHHGGAA